MVAIRPKRFSEVNPSNWAFLTDALQEFSENRTFYCGKCKNMIRVYKEKDKPKFCTICGIELDWTGHFPTIIKFCVKCKKEFGEHEEYCDSDGSKLNEKPIKK